MENLILHAFNYQENDKENNIEFKLWCKNRESETVLLKLRGFYNYFFLEVEDKFTDDSSLNKIFNYIKTRSEFASHYGVVYFDKVLMEKFFYEQFGKKSIFMKIYFSNNLTLRFCKNLLSRKINFGNYYVNVRAHDTNISFLRRFFTVNKTKYCQWFNVNAKETSKERKIYNGLEYIGNMNTFKPIPFNLTSSWFTFPKVMAFDIECYSDNHKAMPVSSNRKHKAYMISVISQIYRKLSTRKRYVLLIGDCEDLKESDECEVIKIKPCLRDEKIMLNEMAKIIAKENPDIITGYNTHGFDFLYLHGRLKLLMEDWPNFGRSINEECIFYNDDDHKYGKAETNKINKYPLKYLIMPGRISVDIIAVVRRDYNFDKNDLNTVSSKILGKEKHDVTPVEMFIYYENMMSSMKNPEAYPTALSDMTKVLKYCVQDSELTIDLFEKMNIWISMVEMANILEVTPFEYLHKGLQLRFFNQVHVSLHKKNIVMDKEERIGGKFKGGLVQKPVKGLTKNVTCLDFCSLYPSICIAYNFCINTYILPQNIHKYNEDDYKSFDIEEINEDDNTTSISKHYYYTKKQGTIPQILSSLLSERKIAKNEMFKAEIKKDQLELLLGSIDTIIKNTENNKDIDMNQINQVLEQEEVKSYLENKISINFEDFKNIRNFIFEKFETHSLIYIIFNIRQTAIKLSCNSVYGALAPRKGGMLPFPEIAKCITSMGRKHITDVSEFIETKYKGNLIYGDTDSVMFDMNLKDSNQCFKWGNKLADEISGILPGGKDFEGNVYPEGLKGLFPSPLKLAYEKSMDIFCITPKHYFAYMLNKDGKPEKEYVYDYELDKKIYKEKVLHKGDVMVRRDNCPFAKRVYDYVSRGILSNQPFEDIIHYIIKAIKNLKNNKVNYKELTTVRELNSNYKFDTAMMKKFSDKLKKEGKIVNSGDRLVFIFIENKQSSYRGDKAILVEDYINNKDFYNLDYEYYLEKDIATPIEQLISIHFKDILLKTTAEVKRSSACRKYFGLSNIITFIILLLKQNISLDEIEMIIINQCK